MTQNISSICSHLVSKFPQNFSFCFAYGSAVKKQIQNSNALKENMIDLIFCVDNPSAWHAANLRIHQRHYSSLKFLGHNFITHYQRKFGSKVYFNTLVSIDGFLVKYGVVATEDLITDLLEWSDLYLAGRLHKPVEIIRSPDGALKTALELNLQSAVHTALLILPDVFTEYEFFHTICNLSYVGDFRMTFGENKSKVQNIVQAQFNNFRNLYQPFLKSLYEYVEFPSSLKNTKSEYAKFADDNEISPILCLQDVDPLARLHHLNQLPRWPQKAITRLWNKGSFRQDTEDVLRALAYDPDCGLIVKQCISDIVWRSSIKQSLKGIATAGLVKSVIYSSRKLKKMLYSQ